MSGPACSFYVSKNDLTGFVSYALKVKALYLHMSLSHSIQNHSQQWYSAVSQVSAALEACCNEEGITMFGRLQYLGLRQSTLTDTSEFSLVTSPISYQNSIKMMTLHLESGSHSHTILGHLSKIAVDLREVSFNTGSRYDATLFDTITNFTAACTTLEKLTFTSLPSILAILP